MGQKNAKKFEVLSLKTSQGIGNDDRLVGLYVGCFPRLLFKFGQRLDRQTEHCRRTVDTRCSSTGLRSSVSCRPGQTLYAEVA